MWVSAPDVRGRNPKTRPFVILNNPRDIKGGAILVGVAVTSTFREPVGAELVPMRWNARGTVQTGFREKCFAKVDWAHKIPVYRGEEFELEFNGEFHGKHVRLQELANILEARARVDDRTGRGAR